MELKSDYHQKNPSYPNVSNDFQYTTAEHILTAVLVTFMKPTHTIKEIADDLDSYWGKEVIVSGWIDKRMKRVSNHLAFTFFRDFEGNTTQLLTTETKIAGLINRSHVEDCVTVKGTVERRKARNEKEEGRWDIKISEYKVLNSSDILGSQLEASKETPANFPPEYRYMQLRVPYYQQALKKRAQAAKVVRDELSKLNFTEVETPLLFKSTPEGAREFLVPTRNRSLFYALPQSPQQYKQLLMASGVKNYFQIAKCFRDEDLRADRQPEFTQVDMEMSFADAKDVQNVIESTVKKVWTEVAKEEIKTIDGPSGIKSGDLVHLSYDEALSKYGIDKPDLRSSLEVEDMGKFATGIEDVQYSVFEVCVLRGAFKPNKKVNLQNLKNAELYRNRTPIVVAITNEAERKNWTSRFTQIAKIVDAEGMKAHLNLQIGDIIAGSTRSRLSYENPTPLGKFRQLAITEYPKKWRRDGDPKFVGAWVENFPLFTPSEIPTTYGALYPLYDYGKLESTHHPFTMVKPDDYHFLETDPLEAKGEHYDLVVNGVELGGGSRRVHDSDVQRYILSEILKVKNPDILFGHLLKALSLGCPPHAGFAIGFDRMCAMLISSQSIRDVIAFPKNQAGGDMVVGSPSSATDEVLQEYHIQLETI